MCFEHNRSWNVFFSFNVPASWLDPFGIRLKPLVCVSFLVILTAKTQWILFQLDLGLVLPC